MPYQIDRYNGTTLITVDDGTVSNERTSLKLVGKNYAGYGEIQNENFVFLLENFSNTYSPANALSGQIWYDSLNKKLKFYDGTSWRTTGGAEIGSTSPTGLTTGDFWFNTNSKQLFAWDSASNNFVLIGPQAVAGSGQTNLESVSVTDTLGNSHAIVKAVIDGDVAFIISTDEFTLNPTLNADLIGFSFIKQGITLVNSASGTTTSAFRFWGTASDSDKLGGFTAASYIKSSSPTFTGLASFDDNGFTVGDNANLRVYMRTIGLNKYVTLENLNTDQISFRVKTGTIPTSTEIVKIEGTTFVPGTTDAYDLGTNTLRWNNIKGKNITGDTITANTFVGNFSGAASNADKLLYNSLYRSATDANTPNTIVARDLSGNFSANIINAISQKAYYADLAERYVSDRQYDPGTVVVFGGNEEITVTDNVGDHRVAGVISTAPAYLMNDVDPSHPPVALRGKVPVKVIGKVLKGDVLITSGIEGHAISAGDGSNISASAIFAKAIENKNDEELGSVMAVIV